MKEKSTQRYQYKGTPSPLCRRERYRHRYHTQHDEEIDEEEPYITGKTIKHTAQHRILLGHTSQLPIGTVKRIGKEEQQRTYEHHLHIARKKEIPRCGTKKNRHDSNGIGMDMQPTTKTSFYKANGANDPNVPFFFGIHRLIGGAHLSYEALPTCIMIFSIHSFFCSYSLYL